MASYQIPNQPRFQGGIDTYTGRKVGGTDISSDFEKPLAVGVRKHLWLMSRPFIKIVSYARRFSGI